MGTISRFFISLIFFVMLAVLACNGPTEPEFKNPREYTWTATQIAYPGSGQTRLYSIWGSSPSNVYACGFSLLSGNQGAIYHYDGNQWRPVTTLPSPDYNYFWEMTGFGENDIWVSGSQLFPDPSLDSATVLHFNGTQWTQQLPSHMGVEGLKSIGGNSSRNLIVGSRDGKVIRYNGTTWKVDTLYRELSIETVGGDEKISFATGNTFRGALNDSVMSFKDDSHIWDLVDVQLLSQHLSSPRFGRSHFFSPAEGLYYSTGSLGIFQWKQGEWEKVFSPIATVLGMYGSQSSLIAVGWNAKPLIFHWDGTNWDEVKLPNGIVPDDVVLYGVWTDGREAFVIGNNGVVSYVLHGK